MSKKKLKLKELHVESFVTNENDQDIKGGNSLQCPTSFGCVMLSVSLSLLTRSTACVTNVCSYTCGGGSAGMCSPDTPDSWGTCAY